MDLTRPVIVPGLGVIPQAPGPAPIYLTLFTSMFMHAGLLHLAGNMLYLAHIGGFTDGVILSCSRSGHHSY